MCAALLGVAVCAPAPQQVLLAGGGDQASALVDQILAQLDGPIDTAIAAALGGAAPAPQARTRVTEFSGTLSAGPAITVSTQGTLLGDKTVGKFSSVSTSQESSSSFSSNSVGEWSAWTTVGTAPAQQTASRPASTASTSSSSSSSVDENSVVSTVVA